MICKAKPYMGDEPYIFVSYCHDDSAAVYPIIERMVSDGYRIWYDEGISPGTDWTLQIAEKLIKSKVCLIVMTPASSRSHNCRTEMTFAMQNGITVLSLKMEEFEMPLAIKFQLAATQMILAYQYTGQAFFDKLYSAEELTSCKGEKGKLLTDAEIKTYEEELRQRQEEIDLAREKQSAEELAHDFVKKNSLTAPEQKPAPAQRSAPEPEPENTVYPAAEEADREAEAVPNAAAQAAAEEAVRVNAAQERERVTRELAQAENALHEAEQQAASAEKAVQDENEKRTQASAAWEEKHKALSDAAEEAKKLAEQTAKALADAEAGWETTRSAMDSAVEQAEQKQHEAMQNAVNARQLVSVLQAELEQYQKAEQAAPAVTANESAAAPKQAESADDVTVMGDMDDDVTVMGDMDDDVTVMGGADDEATVMGDSDDATVFGTPILVQFSTGKLFACRTNMTKLGQDPHMCDVSIAGNPAISQHHADIIVRNGKNYILDAESTNGTYVDGIRLENGGKAEIQDYAEIGLSASELFLLAFGNTAAKLWQTMCLMCLRSEKTGEAIYFFEDETLNLGRRNPWKSGAMSSKTVGRHQADLTVSGTQCTLTDVSTYGSYLNDKKMEPQTPVVLQDGDRLKFGEEYFVFSRITLQKGDKS